MFRKLSIILAGGLLAFTAACSSSSSTTAATAATGAAVAATSTPAACPTKNTQSFAKTRFVADLAIAGGAFKRYIYTPAKSGKFAKGANGRVLAFVKAAAAGALTVNRLEAAKTSAQANPTLCKLLAEPIAKFSAAVSGLVGKAKSGNLSSSDVENTNGYLSDLHGAASQGGAAFTDNTNTSA
jgi:type IV secretory pathway VirJ component